MMAFNQALINHKGFNMNKDFEIMMKKIFSIEKKMKSGKWAKEELEFFQKAFKNFDYNIEKILNKSS